MALFLFVYEGKEETHKYMQYEVWLSVWANAYDANANDDRQSMIVQGSLIDKPNELKTGNFVTHFQNSKSSNRCRSVYGTDKKNIFR